MTQGLAWTFSSPRRGLQCATAIQRSFADYNAQHPDDPLRLHIGLHTGEAINDTDDFYGRAVILASRIADQAQGGQILVSSLLVELTESVGDIRVGEHREARL